MDKHGITILYHLHQFWTSYVHHEIFHAKVGKGGIKDYKQYGIVNLHDLACICPQYMLLCHLADKILASIDLYWPEVLCLRANTKLVDKI